MFVLDQECIINNVMSDHNLLIVKYSIDEIIRCLLTEPIKDTDDQFTAEIRNPLLEEKSKPSLGWT